MTAVYYNEINPFCADWLRRLMHAGAIPQGFVDERSIEDVAAIDVMAYRQCHWFAGIGGWAHALQLAGWGERSVWTGSCPCQPFSTSGGKDGARDKRHLWPAWFRLIGECRPRRLFGEQVVGAIGFQWFDRVCLDLEAKDYAIAAAVLPASAVGAPHRRYRLWYVADAVSGGQSRPSGRASSKDRGIAERYRLGSLAPDSGAPSVPLAGPWTRAAWLACSDGKARPFEPGFLPMAHGFPGRVDMLRAFGNAIVPQVAAEFIAAFMDTQQRTTT